MRFPTLSFYSYRTLLIIATVGIFFLLYFATTVASQEKKEGRAKIFADKSKIVAKERVTVIVKGVQDPLLRNIYNHLAIYRLRSHPRLQEVSVYQLFRQAETDIAKALAPFGYYNPKIQSAITAEPSQPGEELRWKTIFKVNAGTPVQIAEIDFQLEGEGCYNSELKGLLRNFSLQEKEILNQEFYEQEKKKFLNIALSQGYLDAHFTQSEIRIDKESNRGWITLRFNTGKRYLFGSVTVVTDPPDAFKDTLLQGYLPWKEGEPYSFAKLFELQSILYGTDYFTAVDIRGKAEKAENGRIPVEAILTIPEKYNKYTVGLGYATDSGVKAKLNWKNRMFNANGDKIGAALEVAERERNIYFTYERPRKKNPRYDRHILASSYQDKTWTDTDTRLLTTSLGRDYSTPTLSLGGGIEFRDEVYTIRDASGHSTLFVPSATIGLVFADDLINTKNGLRLFAEVRGALEGQLSDTNFFQWTVGGKALLTPFEKWRLSGRASLGMTMVDSFNRNIPPSLRFYAGGDNSIRGYSYRSIGPKDASGTVIGGKYLTVQSVELERMLGQSFGVASFWDVGTATNDLSLSFYQGAGVGLRVHMPFGEIRLDLASAISEPGTSLRVHFSVGGTL